MSEITVKDVTCYNLDINERQRAYIEKALKLANETFDISAEAEDVQLLEVLFAQIKHDEKITPKCTHGLCY